MKALVIRQPWAELIAAGDKTIELRNFRTAISDEFLIVAGKTVDATAMRQELRPLLAVTDSYAPIVLRPRRLAAIDLRPGAINELFPTGVAIAVARVYRIEPAGALHEAAAGCAVDGYRFAWYLGNVHRIRPFPVRGMPGFFEVKLHPKIERV